MCVIIVIFAQSFHFWSSTPTPRSFNYFIFCTVFVIWSAIHISMIKIQFSHLFGNPFHHFHFTWLMAVLTNIELRNINQVNGVASQCVSVCVRILNTVIMNELMNWSVGNIQMHWYLMCLLVFKTYSFDWNSTKLPVLHAHYRSNMFKMSNKYKLKFWINQCSLIFSIIVFFFKTISAPIFVKYTISIDSLFILVVGQSDTYLLYFDMVDNPWKLRNKKNAY